jgi:5-(carboxyamino)imidazole ribonucleotide synthase
MSQKHIPKLNLPATIGIIGGGQLGRMMAFEAKKMGYRVIVLDPKESAPAAQVCDEQIVCDFTDCEGLHSLAQKSDVLTYEFEHLDADKLYELEQKGYRLYPSATTLRKINNKYVQKSLLKEAGLAVPDLCLIETKEDLVSFFHKHNGKLVLKSCMGGYDGKGNRIVTNEVELNQSLDEIQKGGWMAEAFVPYVKEVSILVVRNEEEIVYYPIAENVHEDSILIHSKIPAVLAPDTEKKIQEMATRVAEVLDDYGVFCVEMFVDARGDVLINEIAPRPHNSGHYTIEACVSSQFQQIIRVITGMPLGSPSLRKPAMMYNLLGDKNLGETFKIEGLEHLLKLEDCHFHFYGKAVCDYLKKIGHITVLAETLDEAEKKAEEAMKLITQKESE